MNVRRYIPFSPDITEVEIELVGEALRSEWLTLAGLALWFAFGIQVSNQRFSFFQRVLLEDSNLLHSPLCIRLGLHQRTVQDSVPSTF